MAAKKKSKAKAKKKNGVKAKPKKVSFIPKGYATVTPALNLVDASKTIAFCKEVFGAKVRMSMQGPNGKLAHCELTIGDSCVMLSDAVNDAPRVSSLFLYVKDVDKTVAKAVSLGAKIMMPVQTQFWGDRFGRIVDPQGNFWSIATHVEDVSTREMKKRGEKAMKEMAAQAAGAPN